MIILYCLLGAGAGVLAGLVPGLHTNNIAVLVLASPFFGTEVTAFMLSMCIVQSFVDFIPSIYLGAPSVDTFEGVLPGHKMFLKGRAHEAICITVFGGIIAVIVGSMITPLFFLFIAQNAQEIILVTPGVLIFSVIIMCMKEKNWKKRALAVFVVCAATSQGMLFKEQIFPLITGYFGVPTLLYSIKEKIVTAKQTNKAEVPAKTIVEALTGAVGGAIVAVMPGIGSNVAAAMIKTFKNKIGSRKYLAMLGSINTSNFFFSYATLFALDKARNGAMLVLREKIIPTGEMLYYGTAIMLFAGGLGGLITILLSKKALNFFSEKKTFFFSIGSIILMIFLVGAFNGTQGLIALGFSGALGLFVLTKKIRRSICMSSLIVPTLFFYLFILI